MQLTNQNEENYLNVRVHIATFLFSVLTFDVISFYCCIPYVVFVLFSTYHIQFIVVIVLSVVFRFRASIALISFNSSNFIYVVGQTGIDILIRVASPSEK